jgi:hypothetical protein
MRNLIGFVKAHQTADVSVTTVRLSQQTGGTTTVTMMMITKKNGNVHSQHRPPMACILAN